MRNKWIILCASPLLLVSLLLSSCTCNCSLDTSFHPGDWNPSSLGVGNTIVYQSLMNGHGEIFAMKSDGSDQIQLTDNAIKDIDPTCSPNGTKIAWVSNRDGNDEIYVMDIDGLNKIRLTNNLGVDHSPTWSPDGTQIAFISEQSDGSGIYVMNADGSPQQTLVTNVLWVLNFEWSPDGSRILFDNSDYDLHDIVSSSSPDLNIDRHDVYVVNADGSNLTNLTNNSELYNYLPVWSHDGTEIAFTSHRSGNGDIYAMDADGSNQTRLTDNPYEDARPTWSPDGTKIAFKRYYDEGITSFGLLYGNIYVMNADGSNQTKLTAGKTDKNIKAWSFGSSSIFYYVEETVGENSIYVMKADGTNQTKLAVTKPL